MSDELVVLEHPVLSEERGEPARVTKPRKAAEVMKRNGWIEVDPDTFEEVDPDTFKEVESILEEMASSEEE
ncbi:MAG: hypothetical protein R3330_05805 [Saprospiraceae bacterium]|nr:hypothetical protein [Saprospiraceae bacterium]